MSPTADPSEFAGKHVLASGGTKELAEPPSTASSPAAPE